MVTPAVDREGIVLRTSSTPIRVIDTVLLYGLGRRRSQRADDRDLWGCGDPARYSFTNVKDGDQWLIADHHSSAISSAPPR